MDDLQLLVQRFLEERDALDKVGLFTPEVMAQMNAYDWPGNVRELRNYVERRVVLEHHVETLGHTLHAPPVEPTRSEPPRSAPPAAGIDLPFKEAKDQIVADFERAYLTELLRWAGGNVSKAARKAQLDRMHLHRLFQRYGLRSAGALEE
jgi:DNA-binding NtrC family response regulator